MSIQNPARSFLSGAEAAFDHLVVHCRAGFEKEAAAEIQAAATRLGLSGYIKAREDEAHLVWVSHNPGEVVELLRKQAFDELVFVRQWFAALPLLSGLPVTDRVGPLLERSSGLPAAQLPWLETPDTNEGKELSVLCRKLARPLEEGLKRAGLVDAAAPGRWQALWLAGDRCYWGQAPVHNSAPWPMGIPRLRFPGGAPSRSTLKLEEAWHWFIPRDDWDARLAVAMHAVDLGAAPGGWTWQLVNRGMLVQAVDNGPMNAELMDSGQVTHLREDGFLFKPKRPVQWMVCDIVDRPARVAELVARWGEQRLAREIIFNLKLPMKKRYEELQKCAGIIEERLAAAGVKGSLRFKQLYHDREEVTGHLVLA